MTKRKYNVFVDIITVLCIVFPLIMALFTAWSCGVFEGASVGHYVENFAISSSLAVRIGECINTFGIALDGAFFGASMTILSNAMLIYIFRVFLGVIVWLPKFAIKMLNIAVSED